MHHLDFYVFILAAAIYGSLLLQHTYLIEFSADDSLIQLW